MDEFLSQLLEEHSDDPVILKAVDNFIEAISFASQEEHKDFMCKIIATIGLELETKFPEVASFNDEQFKLFGRKKSKNSTDKKIKHNIESFVNAYKEKDTNNLPTQVRPIFDYYAFKFVCPELKNPREIIKKVLLVILNDIEANHPEHSQQISECRKTSDKSFYGISNYILTNFSDEYPELKSKLKAIFAIFDELKQTPQQEIEKFLKENNSDVSSLTLSEYQSKIIKCYNFLLSLSYPESTEERKSLEAKYDKAKNDYVEMCNNRQEHLLIPEEKQVEYSETLKNLLSQIKHKRTNKLDLALGDLMIWATLITSDSLKKLGINIISDSEKRTPKGYVANFYRVCLPNNLIFEIQIQSKYRYVYSEAGGPAAHNKMPNGEKKREFIELPENNSDCEEWADLQFKSLPEFIDYLGKGFVKINNTKENFERHYNTEDPEKVKEYVRFIVEHHFDLLDSKILIFNLADAPRQLKNDNEHEIATSASHIHGLPTGNAPAVPQNSSAPNASEPDDDFEL